MPKRELPPKSTDYMASMDLPSSSDSEEEKETTTREETEPTQHIAVVSAKDTKKMEQRERKILEQQAAAKAAALRDDDNVFDVSFERQGDGDGTVSATDIKVCATCCTYAMSHVSCFMYAATCG